MDKKVFYGCAQVLVVALYLLHPIHGGLLSMDDMASTIDVFHPCMSGSFC